MKSFCYILSKLGTTIATFVVSIVLARVLCIKEYATFLQIFLIVQILSNVLSFGLPRSIYFFSVKYNQSIEYLTMNMLSLIGLVSCLLILLFIDNIAHFVNNQELSNYSIYLAILLGTRIVNQSFQPIMINLSKTNQASIILTIYSVLIIVNVTTWSILDLPLSYLLSGYCTIEFLLILVIYYEFFQVQKIKMPIVELAILKSQLIYCYPLAIAIITSLLYKRMDQIIVSHFFSPAQFAIYSRGAIDLPIIPIIVYSMMGLISPKLVGFFSEQKFEAFAQLVKNTFRQCSYFTISSTIFFLLFHKELIVLLFGESFEASAPIFAIYLFSVPLQTLSYDAILQCIGDTRSILLISLFGMFSNLIVSLMLLPYLQLYGPVIATIGSLAIMFLLYIVLISRRLNKSILSIVPFKEIFHIFVISLIAAIPCIFWKGFSTFSSPINLCAAGISFGLVFLFLFAILPTVDPVDRKLAHNLLSSIKRPQ